MNMNVRVMLDEPEKLGILRCRLEEVKDPSGLLSMLKAVKFRVEFQQLRDDSMPMVSLAVIHGKGSIETFKEVYKRLERDWSLDVVGIPPREVVGAPISRIEGQSLLVE